MKKTKLEKEKLTGKGNTIVHNFKSYNKTLEGHTSEILLATYLASASDHQRRVTTSQPAD